MISFTHFLSEARLAPLYHGTDAFRAENIIKYNMINGDTIQDAPLFAGKKYEKFSRGFGGGVVHGVSLSRRFNTSARFGSVVFELDQQKLAQNYKIIPFNYQYSRNKNTAQAREDGDASPRNEQEEFVLGSIKNLDKYLINIWYNKTVSLSYYQYIADHPKAKPMTDRK